jgi:hypothetical protein
VQGQLGQVLAVPVPMRGGVQVRAGFAAIEMVPMENSVPAA